MEKDQLQRRYDDLQKNQLQDEVKKLQVRKAL